MVEAALGNGTRAGKVDADDTSAGAASLTSDFSPRWHAPRPMANSIQGLRFTLGPTVPGRRSSISAALRRLAFCTTTRSATISAGASP